MSDDLTTDERRILSAVLAGVRQARTHGLIQVRIRPDRTPEVTTLTAKVLLQSDRRPTSAQPPPNLR